MGDLQPARRLDLLPLYPVERAELVRRWLRAFGPGTIADLNPPPRRRPVPPLPTARRGATRRGHRAGFQLRRAVRRPRPLQRTMGRGRLVLQHPAARRAPRPVGGVDRALLRQRRPRPPG
ncbi:MAG: hypothetical protein E6G57_15055 [Actinobacteria bacterium]|nr:MAG: hypothetical protein E6G57_15055 [Actinomycetota bacterium]